MFVQVGDLKLDIEHRLLYLNGSGSASPQLDPMEARLLATLMEFPDQVVSRAHLMRKVWQTNYLDDTRTLDVHICWLRRKVENDPAHPRRIITHRNRGYQLRV
jgi:DNA-binding response OmpR family regulator